MMQADCGIQVHQVRALVSGTDHGTTFDECQSMPVRLAPRTRCEVREIDDPSKNFWQVVEVWYI